MGPSGNLNASMVGGSGGEELAAQQFLSLQKQHREFWKVVGAAFPLSDQIHPIQSGEFVLLKS